MKVRNVRKRQWRQWEYRRVPTYPRIPYRGYLPYKPSRTAARWWSYKWPGTPRFDNWRGDPYEAKRRKGRVHPMDVRPG